jgi:hypothetical protein
MKLTQALHLIQRRAHETCGRDMTAAITIEVIK